MKSKNEKKSYLGSYFRVPKDNFLLNKEEYLKTPRKFDQKKVGRKPSFLKKLFHTFFN